MTYLQVNVGTLLPYLLDDVDIGAQLSIDAPIVFSSLVFEGSRLRNLTFRNAMLLNVSIARVDWKSVHFMKCQFAGVTIDTNSRFDSVTIENCAIEDLRVARDTEFLHRDYAPERIQTRLEELGLVANQPQAPVASKPTPESFFNKSVLRVLRLFYRTTTISEVMLQSRFEGDAAYMTDNVIPLLEKYHIVEERPWKGGGQYRIWTIRTTIDRVFAAGEGSGDPELLDFWKEVRSN
jgi:hypothetical protein